MLRAIDIRDYVIVEKASLEIGRGFTVLTGETGAGKSILVDAIELLVGGKGDASLVREGAERAEIIWEDAEVDLFCQMAPEQHADAVRLARETGLRVGDLVELERSEIRRAPDGGRAIILRPNKRRRRIVNMPLTPAAEAIIDKAPLSRRLILKPLRADTWDSARLSREVPSTPPSSRSGRSFGSTTCAGRR